MTNQIRAFFYLSLLVIGSSGGNAPSAHKTNEKYQSVGSDKCLYKDELIHIDRCNTLCVEHLETHHKYAFNPKGFCQKGECWCQCGIEGTATLKVARLEDLEKKVEKEDRWLEENLVEKSKSLKKGYRDLHDKKYGLGKKSKKSGLLDDSE